MAQFYFQAANDSGQQISGIIEADSEDQAKQKIKQRDLALFSVQPYDPNKNKTSDLKTFEFQGIDADSQVVRGKIEAKNEASAYKKLRLDYNFNLTALIDADLPDFQKQALQAQGINPEIKAWFEKEFGAADQSRKDSLIAQQKQKIALSNQQKSELQVLQEKIGEVIVEVAQMLEKNAEFLDANKRREIEDRINLLSRLRQSNALDHLKSLTDKILEQLTDDTIFLEGRGGDSDVKSEEIEKRKTVFKKFAHSFDKSLRQELSTMTINLENLDAGALAKKMTALNPFQQFGNTLYFGVSCLFISLAVFWFLQSFQIFLQSNPAKTSFYLFSEKLWFFTFLSFICAFGLAPIIFIPLKDRPLIRNRIFLSVGAVAFLFLVFFPWILIWTR